MSSPVHFCPDRRGSLNVYFFALDVRAFLGAVKRDELRGGGENLLLILFYVNKILNELVR